MKKRTIRDASQLSLITFLVTFGLVGLVGLLTPLFDIWFVIGMSFGTTVAAFVTHIIKHYDDK